MNIKLQPIILSLFLFVFLNSSFAQKYRSEIIESKIYYQLRGDKIVESGSRIIQINTRMGDNDANAHIYYSKGDKVKIKDAWIQDISGNVIRKLKKNEIVDISAVNSSSLYTDRYLKTFELTHNQRPYQLVYNYECERSKYLTIADIDCSRTLQKIKNYELIVETNTSQPIKFTQENINEPEIESYEGGIKYTWRFNYNPPMKYETWADRNSILAPRLKIVPQSFKVGATGSFDTWQSFGNWMWRLNEGRDELPDSEKIKIDELVKDITSVREKARVLYHYMQDNTRYINISTKIGGLQAHPAEYVCTNRYGDCKALTNCMQAMLKYVGIRSYYTLIDSDDSVNDFDTNFPYDPFNHVILTLPIDNDTIFLECTSQNLAFGYIPTSNQGRKALLVDKDNSCLIDIPTANIENVNSTRFFDVQVDNVYVSGNLYTQQRGRNYELYKFIQKGINKNIADSYIHENILIGSYSLNNLDFKTSDRDSSYTELCTSFRIDNAVKKYGNNLVISPFSWSFTAFELPANRTQNLQIDNPIHKSDSIIYHINDFKINKVPDNILIDTPYGIYKIEYNIENEHTLIINKEFKLYNGRYSLKEYGEFHQFITHVTNNELKNFYIEIL